MIGIDTNILLRLFLDDDAVQGEKVRSFFSQLPTKGPGYVNCITLMEFVWFLRRSAKLSRLDVMAGLSDLLDTQDIVLEDEHIVEATLDIMATSTAEFADVFIGLRNRAAGCSVTRTFDEKAAQMIPGMELMS